MIGYHAGLIRKYGEEVIPYLEIKKHNTARYGKFEYQVLIKFYAEKVKQLKIKK
jgi:hypothetical protein